MHHNNSSEPPMRVNLPADVERPDTIIGNYTTRQVTILGITALSLWLLWATTKTVVPIQVFLAIAAPAAVAGFAMATLRRDGISLDRWLLAAIKHSRSPKTRVAGVATITAPPAWVRTSGKVALPAPLRLPAKGIDDGLINLGPDGHAALVACGTVNLQLRSVPEQNAMVAGYARWLNSLDAPAQILIRSRRVDLTPMAATLLAGAAALRDPHLEQAARAHAQFLHQLCQERELLHRQVTVVVRDKRSPVHAAHRAAEAAAALAGCEITTQILGSEEVAATLAESVGAPETALTTSTTTTTVVTARSGQ